MEQVDGSLIFSASDLINHLECAHLTELNIEVALGRADLEPSRSDRTELVARKGDEHERGYLAQLRADRLIHRWAILSYSAWHSGSSSPRCCSGSVQCAI
jgi:hypothetical protein